MARGSNARGSFRGNFRGRSGGFRRGGASGRGGASSRGGEPSRATVTEARQDEASKAAERLEKAKLEDEIDDKMGFTRFQEGPKREGWLVNMHPVSAKHFLNFLNHSF
jgi:DNA polymerase epsilon subunit 1